MIKHVKTNYYSSLFKENMSNLQCFWKQIKNCYASKSESNISKVLKDDGKLLTDKKEIAKRFCSYFSNIGLEIHQKIQLISSWSYLTQSTPKNSPLQFPPLFFDLYIMLMS